MCQNAKSHFVSLYLSLSFAQLLHRISLDQTITKTSPRYSNQREGGKRKKEDQVKNPTQEDAPHGLSRKRRSCLWQPARWRQPVSRTATLSPHVVWHASKPRRECKPPRITTPPLFGDIYIYIYLPHLLISAKKKMEMESGKRSRGIRRGGLLPRPRRGGQEEPDSGQGPMPISTPTPPVPIPIPDSSALAGGTKGTSHCHRGQRGKGQGGGGQ